MKKTCLALSLLPALFLTACGGEISYKRGAGPDELAVNQQQCRSTNDYQACMESKGWTVHRIDERNPLAVFVPTQDVRVPNDGSPYVKSSGGNMPANGVKENPALPPDPLTKFNVSSWWKMGGGAGDLEAAKASCVAKLGPAHAPEEKSKLMTRGLILCLKEQGWYGLQGY
ncbi:MAG TPA: hypothetical protein VL381_10495 [Rhodocyclaceae bacterium]|jgi:hypothetical protein|nr:hypothetical protein [Rhodocyclaceae bacterium]